MSKTTLFITALVTLNMLSFIGQPQKASAIEDLPCTLEARCGDPVVFCHNMWRPYPSGFGYTIAGRYYGQQRIGDMLTDCSPFDPDLHMAN